MTREHIETVFSGVITLAAVIVAAVVFHRGFIWDPSSQAPSGLDRPSEPVYVESWEELLSDGIELGKPDAELRVIQFADLECPYCAAFHRGPLRDALAEHEEPISVTFIHLPLGMHRFAVPAAHAAECALERDRFAEYVDAVYAKQDSLGLRSWWAYAEDAGIEDRRAFEECLQDDPPSRIAAGRAWADELNITATPTVLINGWRLPEAPRTSVELLEILASVGDSTPPQGHVR